nr:ABC transporter ATP-binding protein [Micromonospora sp. DSM 115978]
MELPKRAGADDAAPLAEIEIPYWLTGTAEAANATFWRMLRRLPSLLRQASGLAWRTSRAATTAVVVLHIGAGLASAVSLVNVVGVLDGLLAAGPTPDRIRAAVPSLLVVVGAATLRGVLGTAATAAQGRLSPQVSRAAELRLLELTTRVDLATFDDAEWRDAMHRARDRGIDATQRVVDNAIDLGTALVGLIASASVLAVLHPVLLPLLVVAVLPNGWAAVRSARMGYRSQLRMITMLRRKWMLSDLLADRDAGPELRAFTLRDYLLGEVRRLLDVSTRQYVELSDAQVRAHLAGRALGGVAHGLTYGVLIWLLLVGEMELAVGGAAAYAISVGITALSNIAFAVNHVYEQGLYFSDYTSFSELARSRAEPRPDRGAPDRFTEIVLTGVTFSYPGAERPAVRDVTLTVRRGETIALVGENGSGKSTLAKLLAGLYRPDAGAIRWDGVDLADVGPDTVRDRVAVVMQEPTRWPFSAGTNVSIGRYERPPDPDRVQAAARAGDAHEFIVELSHGYDTLLSRHFVDGADLSGGQWQRLAVSRAFYRDAELLICDEPTANLDARAEHDVYRRLRDLAVGRTVVLITHRMASVRTADRIYVLDHGALIEQGDHEALMARAGTYANLFKLQAQAYQTGAGLGTDELIGDQIG